MAPKAAAAASKKERKKAMSRSARAGLTFPVGRIARFVKSHRNIERIGSGAPVYIAAVLEYLTAELLELAGNVAKEQKKQRVIPRHIFLAARHDEELNKYLAKVTFPSGGVMPNINPALLPKMKKGQKQQSGESSA